MHGSPTIGRPSEKQLVDGSRVDTSINASVNIIGIPHCSTASKRLNQMPKDDTFHGRACKNIEQIRIAPIGFAVRYNRRCRAGRCVFKSSRNLPGSCH